MLPKEKAGLSNVELFRIAKWDDEAFEALVGRLGYIRLLVREYDLTDQVFHEIASSAIDAAVKYALSASDEAVRAMNRPDWLQQVAYNEFRYWISKHPPLAGRSTSAEQAPSPDVSAPEPAEAEPPTSYLVGLNQREFTREAAEDMRRAIAESRERQASRPKIRARELPSSD